MVGGVLIYMDPFAGVVALTLVIAIIFALHGVTQIAFAVRLRGRSGWQWFLVSGCIAPIVSGLLVAKLPYSHSFTPATVAGVSPLFAGCAYVAIRWPREKPRRPARRAEGPSRRKEPRYDKAARRRLCANYRRPLQGQQTACSGAIPVAITAKVVGVAMMDFT